jgi:hypothetical protein
MTLGAVPGYVEISHFRQPYKNSYVGGFGQKEEGGVRVIRRAPAELPMLRLSRSPGITVQSPVKVPMGPQEGAPPGDPLQIEQRTFNGVIYNAYVNPEAVVESMGDFPIVEIEDLDAQFPPGAIMLMDAGSSNPFSLWANDVFQNGFGIVTIETAEGGVYAPVKMIDDISALQASFGPEMVVVIAEPVGGWEKADAAKSPNYLLYGGIAAGAILLLGVAYYASS